MKKNNLVLYTLLIALFFSTFSTNIFAQKTDLLKTRELSKNCAGEKFIMPQTISVENEIFANYIKVASIPKEERFSAFEKLSNEQKADFVKVQLALQLVKRPNMTKEQRNFVLESVSTVSADLYNKENSQKVALANELSQETERKAFEIFAKKDAFEILEGLGTNKTEDITLLQKYEDLLKSGMLLRRKIINNMPIAERVKIWKTQLIYHLTTSFLLKEQKEFIVSIMPDIQSIIEASLTQQKEERDEYLKTLETRIFEVFSKPEAYAVFMTVGIQHKIADDTELLRQFDENYNAQNFTRSQIINIKLTDPSNLLMKNTERSLNQFPSCTCRWYCDMFGYSCNSNLCHQTVSGCGPFDTWACTNRCIEDQPQ